MKKLEELMSYELMVTNNGYHATMDSVHAERCKNVLFNGKPLKETLEKAYNTTLKSRVGKSAKKLADEYHHTYGDI